MKQTYHTGKGRAVNVTAVLAICLAGAAGGFAADVSAAPAPKSAETPAAEAGNSPTDSAPAKRKVWGTPGLRRIRRSAA